MPDPQKRIISFSDEVPHENKERLTEIAFDISGDPHEMPGIPDEQWVAEKVAQGYGGGSGFELLPLPFNVEHEQQVLFGHVKFEINAGKPGMPAQEYGYLKDGKIPSREDWRTLPGKHSLVIEFMVTSERHDQKFTVALRLSFPDSVPPPEEIERRLASGELVAVEDSWVLEGEPVADLAELARKAVRGELPYRYEGAFSKEGVLSPPNKTVGYGIVYLQGFDNENRLDPFGYWQGPPKRYPEEEYEALQRLDNKKPKKDTRTFQAVASAKAGKHKPWVPRAQVSK